MRTRPLAVLLTAAVCAVPAPAQQITPFPNTYAVVDGPGNCVADSLGNVYFAARGVFRVDPSGAVELVLDASSGLPGSTFSGPGAMAVDSQDNLYVACTGSDNVYRLTPDGDVSVVLDVKFDELEDPTTLVVDDQDTVWVGGEDVGGDPLVMSISSTGVVTLEMTETGIGTGTMATLRVFFADGVLFVEGQALGSSGHRLFRRTGAGTFEQLLQPGGAGGNIFYGVDDIAIDTAGNTWVTGPNAYFFRIDPAGVATSLFLTGGLGAQMESTSDGSVWVTSFDLLGTYLTEILPDGSSVNHSIGAAGANYENLVTGAPDTLYWTQRGSVGSSWLWRRTPDGTMTVLIGQLGDGMGNFLLGARRPAARPDGSVVVSGHSSDAVFEAGLGGTVQVLVQSDDFVVLPGKPDGYAVDHLGQVFMSGSTSDTVVRVAPDGDTSVTVIGPSGDGLGHALDTPAGLAVDPSGNLFVTGSVSDNVFRVTPGGVVTQVLDASGDGLGNVLDEPFDAVTDAQGNLFVAGRGSHNVFKVTPAGAVSEILDVTGDGAGPLVEPYGLACDGAGNVYVSGSLSHNVFRVTPAGVVTEILDAGGDGLGNLLQTPRGVAAGWAGDVYVAGQGTSNVFHVSPAGVVTEVLDAGGRTPGLPLVDPVDVEVDAFGVLYVADESEDVVYRHDPSTGESAVLIDASGLGFFGAGLAQPRRLALDRGGNVYVAGFASNTAFRVTQDEWWADLGGPSKGSNGRPTMVCRGDLTPGTTMDRVLTHVPPNALMLAWVAFTSTPFDAIGGTVHAFPFTQQIFFAADASGQSSLFLPWPAGLPSGVDIYLQFVVQDLAVPAGLTLSNACLRTTP